MKNTWLTSAVLLSLSLCNGNSAQAQQAVIVPAGAAMRVRTIDPIDVNSARPGDKFRGTLADPLVSKGGAVLVPRGSPVQLSAVNVRRSGRIRGRDRIDLKVDSLTFNGRTFPVASTIAESRGGRKGSRTLRRTGIGAGAGALIGGIASGGTGLVVGALVGGGGGTAVAAATGGKRLRIPPESVMSFQVKAPLRVR